LRALRSEKNASSTAALEQPAPWVGEDARPGGAKSAALIQSHTAAGGASADGLGSYVVVWDGVPVQSDLSRHSRVLKTLGRGDRVSVVEVANQQEDGRVRARIASPAGWISLRQLGDQEVEYVAKEGTASDMRLKALVPESRNAEALRKLLVAWLTLPHGQTENCRRRPTLAGTMVLHHE
jgi:hypothetical protein